MIVAVEFLQSVGTILQEIKIDHVILDGEGNDRPSAESPGHVVLTDVFPDLHSCIDTRTLTYCSSPDYLGERECSQADRISPRDLDG